ncbi:hypothetical protein SEPCBS119000_004512 [Sporothrix epigloea]|uniref:Uncharacterized protein n=1 Tax=Sporothrix epigloea TaxID=1892477 RepID=A0ABP0DSI6_9PEZI
MGLGDLSNTESDDGGSDTKPAITISPPQPLQQNRYVEFGRYHQRFQPSHTRQQQQTQPQPQPERRKTPPPRPPPPAPLETPEFTFTRSDAVPQQRALSPGGPVPSRSDEPRSLSLQTNVATGHDRLASPSSPQDHRRSFGIFRKSPSRSPRSSRSASISSSIADKGDGATESKTHRLSNRLRLSRTPSTSFHVPANLPEIIVPGSEGDDSNGMMQLSTLSLSSQASSTLNSSPGATSASDSKPAPADPAVEFQWEKRATMLARENERQQQRSGNSNSNSIHPGSPEKQTGSLGGTWHPTTRGPSNTAAGSSGEARPDGTVSSKELDATIQEAIRLHEEGALEQSTRMFGVLADPSGYNNPLSQVLYGLALRHGWGCTPDTEAAVKYLSAAASNAAVVEDMALQAGMNKGGAAKGELVLAIFELANCFRHGWGLERDPIAAKQYYETAANLGDTDAMNEAAWCYLQGFGCKKDKFTAAKYYRLAEQNGNKTLGNSWIWKEKYDLDRRKNKKAK